MLSQAEAPVLPEDDDISAPDAETSSLALQRPKLNPLWLLPIPVGLAVSVGVTMAARPELLINVACVVHPPANASTATFTLDSPFDSIDPEACRHDVGVQRLTAYVQMGTMLITAILSIMTCGFWSNLSDRIGRKKVLAAGVLAMFLDELCFYTVVNWPRIVTRTGVSALFLGPALAGLMGAGHTPTAVINAYVADIIPGDGLAISYSVVQGAILAGVAVAPIMGSWLVKVTDNILTPFKLSMSIQALYVLIVLFILPESLSPEARQQLAEAAAAERKRRTARDAAEVAWQQGSASVAHDSVRRRIGRKIVLTARHIIGKVVAPFEPLRVVLPTLKDPEHPQLGRNWNFTLLIIVRLFFTLTYGLREPKVQYAIFTFGWTQAQLGPLFSLMATAQTLVLLLLFPLVTGFLRPLLATPSTTTLAQVEPTERTPLLAPGVPELPSTSGLPEVPEPATLPVNDAAVEVMTRSHSMRMDQVILFTCMVIDLVGNLVLGADLKGRSWIFIGATVWGYLGSPASPCATSLALMLAPKDCPKGRLMGACSVLDALSGQFIAPILFAAVFSGTISWYPPAIFVVTAILLLVATLILSMIRIPPDEKLQAAVAEPSE